MLSAILFDLSGTLIEEYSDVLNTKQGYYEILFKAIHSSLEKDGISVDWTLFKDHYEQVRTKQKMISEQTLREYDMCERISDTLHFFNHDLPPTSDIIRRAIDTYMNIYIGFIQTKESAHDILKTMAVKYKLGLVTNFAYYPAVYRILDQFDLRRFFKVVVISGEVGWKKPSLRIFEVALSQLSIKPEEAVFIGDDYEVDIIGAKKVGMKTILLSKEPINNEKADVKIKHLKELSSAIRQLSQSETQS